MVVLESDCVVSVLPSAEHLLGLLLLGILLTYILFVFAFGMKYFLR